VKTVPLQYSLQSAAFGLEDKVRETYAARARERALGPPVIEVRDVEKAFRIPVRGASGLAERALGRRRFRELRALQGISFDVRRGEFFGIVGRNGSGKSTLLKILASIYRADRGGIRMAGRLAPFIELGVGFNHELTARENVALNGVMMGLPRREAERRLDAVLDFAGLADFVDLKLKNYSSGMLVRLAFAVMVQADADIMLIDEVLAVGDAAFAQKCMDVFQEKRKAGKTLVLVTHDMATVQSFCDRAMLLHDGRQRYTGDPEETALQYFRLNFAGTDNGAHIPSVPDVNVKLVDVWLEDTDGNRIENVEQGEPIRFNMIAEARQELVRPVFNLHVLNSDGAWIFRSTVAVPGPGGGPQRVAAAERVRISGTIENPLLPGRYSIECWVSRERGQGQLALHVLRLLSFLVYGTGQGLGSVFIPTNTEAVLEPHTDT
jgi:ABC-2 type transport system ATP-binding protein